MPEIVAARSLCETCVELECRAPRAIDAMISTPCETCASARLQSKRPASEKPAT